VIFTVFAIVLLVLTPLTAYWTFLAGLLLALFLILLSRVPLLFILKRSSVIAPFIFLLLLLVPFFQGGGGSYNLLSQKLEIPLGWAVFLSASVKAWLSVVFLVILSSTTRFPDLLKALEKMRVPKILLLTLSFMYRYVFVFIDEAMRMKRARDARSFQKSSLWHINSIGQIIGSLFLRAYERGEMVYKAMLARSFEGKVHADKEFSFSWQDWVFLTITFSVLTVVRLIF
jgi:cobalt/nickel transport system permease protein